jgi:RNA chaperone Hfq
MQARTSGGRDFQDRVLGRLRETGQLATIYLRNRMSVRGRVVEFDPYVVLLEPVEGGPAHLVYKSAMVSVSGPRRPGPARADSDRRPYAGARPPTNDSEAPAPADGDASAPPLSSEPTGP